MCDAIEIPAAEVGAGGAGVITHIGHLLLSPTRTYAPLLKQLLTEHFGAIHGLIHCSGGGRTKFMKYLPGEFRAIKDNLSQPPTIFQQIHQPSGSADMGRYEIFKSGRRLARCTQRGDNEELI